MLDLKPALEGEKLEARILRDLEQYQNRSMENALVDLLPRSMIPVVLRRLDISPEMQANSPDEAEAPRTGGAAESLPH